MSHGLKAYAIGLKMIDKLSDEEVHLDNDIHAYSVNSNLGDRVTASKTLPSGELLIGGGWSAGSGTFAVGRSDSDLAADLPQPGSGSGSARARHQ